MFLAAACLAFLLAPQAPVPTPPAHPAHHSPAATTAHGGSKASPGAHKAAAPAGPKAAPELERDLDAGLRAAPLAGDQVAMSLQGKDITLTGEVHSAEHKGVATREARKIAVKDGWTDVHVLNRIEVKLPQGN